MQDSSTVGCLLQTLRSEFSFAKLSLPVPQGYPVPFRSVKLPLLSFPLQIPSTVVERAFSSATSLLTSPINADCAFN